LWSKAACKLNTWITAERNAYEDYKRAFGEKPPIMSGIAIMTDTVHDIQESGQGMITLIILTSAVPMEEGAGRSNSVPQGTA